MSPTRILILGVAVIFAIIAAVLAVNLSSNAPAPVAQAPAPAVPTNTVLVTTSRLVRGDVIQASNLNWVAWPEESVSPNHIQQNSRPDAISELTGVRVRIAMEEGDPVTSMKIVEPGSGFLAGVLGAGKRAVSTQVTPSTAAGGFILPDDRVDVIMTRVVDGDASGSTGGLRTEVVLQNVRVLAIDQVVQETDGETVVVGNTATLELDEDQAGVLTVAQQLADRITLALRSINDTDEGPGSPALYLIGKDEDGPSTSVSIIRYGNRVTLNP